MPTGLEILPNISGCITVKRGGLGILSICDLGNVHLFDLGWVLEEAVSAPKF